MAYVTIGGIDYPVIFDPPGETANILQLPAITDPTLLKLYGVLEGDANPDRYITYANFVTLLQTKASIRVGQHTVTAGANSVVFKVGGVNTPLASVNFGVIFTKEAILGISDVVKSVNGFTFNAVDPGTIDYIAILNT